MHFYDHQMRQVDPEARRAALSLLARGEVRPHEAAALAGVSLQVMNHWIRRARVDWQRVRDARIAKAWSKALQSLPSRRI